MVPLLPDLARLCTVVFREWPHLYEGDGRYDVDHLRALAGSTRSALIMAYDGAIPVGASTCLPLEDATANVRAPFLARGWPLDRFFYFAESVLLPACRGQGVGATFFAMREAHVRGVSHCDYVCFCAVERPEDHPSRPIGTKPLDGFWRRLGYEPFPDLRCVMTWREMGEAMDSDISLVFWVKRLTS
jgi:GNAT superfamily N-acetyltransferase